MAIDYKWIFVRRNRFLNFGDMQKITISRDFIPIMFQNSVFGKEKSLSIGIKRF